MRGTASRPPVTFSAARSPFAGAARMMLAATIGLMASVEVSGEEQVRTTSVGMSGRIEQIVLPGTELVARRMESREVPVVLRVVATYRHGTAFRYDLEYYALESGRFDLRDYLERKDGSTTDDLPELPIEVVSLLPAGQILPNDLVFRASPRLGGYRVLLLALLVAWVLGLLALLLARRRARLPEQQSPQPEPSLAERLRPLVTAAVEHRLSPEGRAEIERLLLTYWRRRLKLEGMDPVAAVAALRQHEQAGALLSQVEAWLHMPADAVEVDLAALLEPYRALPLNAGELETSDRAPHVDRQTTASGGHA